MIRIPKKTAISMAWLVFFCGAAWAQDMSNATDTPAEEASASCIPLSRIKHMEVVDDQTILFHMTGGEVWENRLPLPCFGLRFEGGVTYKTGMDRLCSGDIISVIRRDTPCGLGLFYLVPDPPGDSESNAEEK